MTTPLLSADMEKLLGRLTPELRRAFLKAVQRLADQIDENRLAELLRAGRTQEAIGIVNAQLAINGMKTLAVAASYATMIAAKTAADAIHELGHFGVVFSTVDTEAMNYLRDNELRLIREMSPTVLASVRAAIIRGQHEGRNPNDVARDVKQFIGLTERQTTAVMNFRSALENLDRTALQRDLRDRRFDGTVDAAITNETQLTPQQIDRMTERYRDRYLAYRAQAIARTEATRAANGGTTLAYKQAISSGIVDSSSITRHWVYTHDSRTRIAHRLIPSMNPNGVAMDQPFKSEYGSIMFPGDPEAEPENSINCRCTLIYNIDQKGRMAAA